MGRGRFRIPGYCLHRATGQAVVRIDGHDYYLGKHGTPASREEYERLIRRKMKLPDRHTGAIFTDLTVNELILRFWRHAELYYRDANGEPSGEIHPLKHALRFLRDQWGLGIAESFSPLKLAAVGQKMISAGLCRNVINGHLSRIKRVFKWGVSQELVPPSVYHGLQAVPGLRHGRSEARETEPIGPVSDAVVDATLPHLAPPVRAMIEVHRLTGMRPGEVCSMRGRNIDTSGATWIYRPEQHKGRHLGRRKEIFLGPRARAILTPFLRPDPDTPLFSPKDTARWWAEQKKRRPQASVVEAPLRAPGVFYTSESYCRAVKYAVAKANKSLPKDKHLPVWHPNQLRHSRATELRREYGLEGAMAALGHTRVETTQIYAEMNTSAARRIAEERG